MELTLKQEINYTLERIYKQFDIFEFEAKVQIFKDIGRCPVCGYIPTLDFRRWTMWVCQSQFNEMESIMDFHYGAENKVISRSCHGFDIKVMHKNCGAEE